MKIKKRLQSVVACAAVFAMAVSLVATASPAEAAGKIKLNKTKLSISAGSKKTIKVVGKKIKSIKWKSSNAKIAAVKKKKGNKAVITAKKKGSAVVKATVTAGSAGKKVLKCKVKVTAAEEKKSEGNNNNQSGNNNNNNNNQAVPVPTDAVTVNNPTPEPTQPGPTSEPTETPVPVLDENNLAVAEYPTVFSDVPDCDFIRVGGNYYMVSTTMNMCPGAPIMKSTDLVHWEIVNYVYDTLFDDDANNLENGKQVYGNGSWAAAIRYYEGKFYVIFNSNNYGFFLFTTDDIENGKWQGYFIKSSFHDPALLFDDGHMYVIYAGSTLQEIQLSEEYADGPSGDIGTIEKVGKEKTLFQKSSAWGLWEGVHAYKIGDYYYLMIIASPATGWFRTEVCYRSKKLLDSEPSDWEEQIVFQGSTYEYGTGIAQGGIVDTIYGDWYGILFQDHDAIGRIPSILAVKWDYSYTDENGDKHDYTDWPMMGYYNDNDEFVSCQSTSDKVLKPLKIRLNDSGKENYIAGDDDFTYAEVDKLKLVWQWNHNPDNDNWSVSDNPGYYRITNGRTCNNVWFARNSLTQRTIGPEYTSETAILTNGMKPGDYAGLVAVGSDYGMVGVKCDENGDRYIFQGSGSCNNSRPANVAEITENAVADKVEGDTEVYLEVEYKFNNGNKRADTANFYYSLDGENWTKIGKELNISFSTSTTFMGTRTWLTNYATSEAGGYVDFDYYKIYQ